MTISGEHADCGRGLASISINAPARRGQPWLRRMLRESLDGAHPATALRRHCVIRGAQFDVSGRSYDLDHYQRIVPVGIGKAAVSMGIALYQLLGERLDRGLCITKDTMNTERPPFRIHTAGHPLPDRRSQRAGEDLLACVRRLTRNDLLIVLLSGGASSLVAAPAPGLTLAHTHDVAQRLLESGASIHEINTVRKHVSRIKGGRLVAETSADVLTLMLSDVQGDDPAVIGSGLTAPDPTTFQQAHDILETYALLPHVPSPVRRHLAQGIAGVHPETPTLRHPAFARVHNVVIGNNQLARDGAAQSARAEGLHVYKQRTWLNGEARNVGTMIASIAQEIHQGTRQVQRPACLIWGGEPVVTRSHEGKGGRAQECALAAAIGIAGLPNILMAGFATDGSDGPTDAAGAVVDGRTIARARRKGVDAHRALARHESYGFFQRVGGHILTGPTHTNVNDLYVLLAL